MNALTLHQPYPTAMALRLKTVETRGWAAPRKHWGERMALAAAKRPLRERTVFGDYEAWPADDPRRPHPNHPDGRPSRLYHNSAHWSRLASWWPLPLGELVASGVLLGSVPIIEREELEEVEWFVRVLDPEQDDGWALALRYDHGEYRDLTSELPWGNYETEGKRRHAWVFSQLASVEERCPWCWGAGSLPWPGFCQSCAAPLDPPEAISCRSCGCSDHDEGGPVPDGNRCRVCNGAGTCAPIDPGPGFHRGIWQWQPT